MRKRKIKLLEDSRNGDVAGGPSWPGKIFGLF